MFKGIFCEDLKKYLVGKYPEALEFEIRGSNGKTIDLFVKYDLEDELEWVNVVINKREGDNGNYRIVSEW